MDSIEKAPLNLESSNGSFDAPDITYRMFEKDLEAA
jgi:hypothetical protein